MIVCVSAKGKLFIQSQIETFPALFIHAEILFMLRFVLLSQKSANQTENIFTSRFAFFWWFLRHSVR